MIWTDEGYLVKLINYSENSIIANFFTNNHGYYSGIIYGGNSKKYKNKLQIGNKLHLHYKSKTEDSLGYFNCELLTSNAFLYFNDKKKLLIFNSIFEISSKIFPERQSFNKIYNSLDNLINNLDEDPLKKFVLWEYDTLCDLGYGYDDQDNIKKSYIPSLLLDRKSDYIFNDLKNILDINKNIYDKQFHDKNIKFYYRNMLNTLFYNE